MSTEKRRERKTRKRASVTKMKRPPRHLAMNSTTFGTSRKRVVKKTQRPFSLRERNLLLLRRRSLFASLLPGRYIRTRPPYRPALEGCGHGTGARLIFQSSRAAARQSGPSHHCARRRAGVFNYASVRLIERLAPKAARVAFLSVRCADQSRWQRRERCAPY